jgi:23S rRNA (guanosine2251-2'-O)-methyltransferase
MKIARVTNLVRVMEDLKQKGFWIYCADVDSKSEIQDIKFEGSVALIIGSEGYGAGKLVKEKSDFLVKIPQKGEIGSLNAANAAAVIIYEIFRQKRIGKKHEPGK